jgi:hypothetical protein
MGGRPHRHNQLTSPLKRVKRTTHQSIKHLALMVRTVTITLTLISCLDGYAMHLQIRPVECWSRNNLPVNISAIARLLHMPRARGRPRRGAAWYAYDSRRKRQKKFERALALASARTTRKHGRPRTPPMAYVEETAPDEPIQDCPEHLLFTVPDNWNPPTVFGNETKLPAPGTSHSRREDEQAEDFTICYVKEELSGSADEKANPTSGAPPGATTQQNSQPAGQLSRENAETEGTHAQGPTLLSTVQKEWEDQPPHINPGYLELLFETAQHGG